MKERLEPTEKAWHRFIIEFPSCPKVAADGQEVFQKILFLCDGIEKNPAELCFAFFGPQILLKQNHAENDLAQVSGIRMVFVYAADLPDNLKPTLDRYQQLVSVPVLVSQRSNVQKSAQHVLDYLRINVAEGDATRPADSGWESARLDKGLMPLPGKSSIWSDPMPPVVLNADDGEDVQAKTDIQDYRAEYACRYVLGNFSKDINRDSMAEMVNLSPGYFSNLFRLEIGMSFSDYLIQVRVDSAKKLLRRFDLSVEEISKRCGFNSLAHFSRTFKDRCGIPPLRYRKNPNA